MEVAAAELESEVRCCDRLRVKERVRDGENGGDGEIEGTARSAATPIVLGL